jgi:hypothetical protein
MEVEALAQLIKLQDYITRYQWDMYRYPSQYIRLKKEQWNKLYNLWENRPAEEWTPKEEEVKKKSAISRMKSIFKRKSESDILKEAVEEEDTLPEMEQELKQYFLDRLFNFQLKWATSTVAETSFIHQAYYTDAVLKYFLQRFPDTYLIMFYPVFSIQNAPVDGEIIMISPVGVEIVYLLEEEKDASIMASDERTWLIETGKEQRKILNPNISLKRTEKIIRSILHTEGHDFPIQKTVLSRNNPIVFYREPYQTKVIGSQQYEKWFREKRKLDSPLKSSQLKTAEILLHFCRTTSVKRPEWEAGTDSFTS